MKKGKEGRSSFLFLEVFPYFLFYIFIHGNKHCYFFLYSFLITVFTIPSLKPLFYKTVVLLVLLILILITFVAPAKNTIADSSA